jgi:hypothetical protein
MPVYTVENNEGKKVTFQWDDSIPPTDDDMESIFSEAESYKVRDMPLSQEEYEMIPSNKGTSQYPLEYGKFKKYIDPQEGIMRGTAEAITKLLTSNIGAATGGIASLGRDVYGLAKDESTDERLQAMERTINNVSEKLTYDPVTESGMDVSEVIEAPFKAIDWVGEIAAKPLEDNYPNLAATVRSLPMSMLVLWGARKSLNPKEAVSMDVKLKSVNDNIGKIVNDNFDKAIKPSTTRGKVNANPEQYNKHKIEGVKAIAENKNNLEFIDKDGNIIEGALPETVAEARQALYKTEADLFKEYDAIQKKAGKEAGSISDLSSISKELDTISKNKPLNDAHPEVASYAINKSDTYRGKKYTTQDLQDAIAIYNKSLEAFNKNPSYEMAQKAGIDALVVNNMRKLLRDAIERTTGDEYQAIKNKYGSLKAIEKDVNRASNRIANQPTSGLIDFTDILTANHVLHGLVSMQPGYIAGGMAGGIAKKMIKRSNNADLRIKKMFKEVDKQINKRNKIINPPKNVETTRPQTPTVVSNINVEPTKFGMTRGKESSYKGGVLSAGTETPKVDIRGINKPKGTSASVETVKFEIGNRRGKGKGNIEKAEAARTTGDLRTPGDKKAESIINKNTVVSVNNAKSGQYIPQLKVRLDGTMDHPSIGVRQYSWTIKDGSKYDGITFSTKSKNIKVIKETMENAKKRFDK